MKRPSILLLSLALAACGAGDESGAASGSPRAGAERRAESEEALITLNDPAVGMQGAGAPPQAPAAGARGQPLDLPTQATVVDTSVVPPPPGQSQPSATLNPMLIRWGTATVEVDSLEAGIAAARALAQRLGGIVGSTSITSGSEETRHATVELRIPSVSFDRAISGLAPLGRVKQVNVSAEDVGEEFTDVTARVANARRLEARLLDLLERRTGRLEEVLNLERELARVREEVERYEGRLRYLRTRTSVSVLTLTMHEPQTVMGRPGERPIRDAFARAWRNFVDMIAGLIAASGILIPLALLAYALWRVVRWIRRRDDDKDAAYREALRRERERSTPPPQEPAAR